MNSIRLGRGIPKRNLRRPDIANVRQLVPVHRCPLSQPCVRLTQSMMHELHLYRHLLVHRLDTARLHIETKVQLEVNGRGVFCCLRGAHGRRERQGGVVEESHVAPLSNPIDVFCSDGVIESSTDE